MGHCIYASAKRRDKNSKRKWGKFKKKGLCIGMVDEPKRILDRAALNERVKGNWAKQMDHKLDMVLQRTILPPVHAGTYFIRNSAPSLG